MKNKSRKGMLKAIRSQQDELAATLAKHSKSLQKIGKQLDSIRSLLNGAASGKKMHRLKNSKAGHAGH